MRANEQTHSMLILRLIAVASVGSKTKNTFAMQKNIATFAAVNIGIGHPNIFA